MATLDHNSDPTALISPLKDLSDADRDLIKEIERFIRAGVPIRENMAECNNYVTANLSLQQRVNTFKSNLEHTCNRRRIQLMTAETEERKSLMYDGFKSGQERDVMVCKNPVVRDLRLIVDWLTVLQRHVDSLEWMLKSALKSVTG